MKHIPVLLDAVMSAIGDIKGKRIVDCTFGAGGYSRAFLESGANVVAFDRDPNVVDDANKLQSKYGNAFQFIPQPFSQLCKIDGEFDAIVFDLGISSMQIDNTERGFSFRTNADLDMRMSCAGKTAADLICEKPVQELADILRKYGDVKKAGAIASAMKEKLPKTTFELRDLIFNPHDIAPVFQALRIAVNDEFGEIERALACIPDKLCIGGKCICITFHSLEDRIVKNTFRNWTTPLGDPRLPNAHPARFNLIKPITPDKQELDSNSRSRSAHMRGVVKSY